MAQVIARDLSVRMNEREGGNMRDRHVLETILQRRFPGAGREAVAAATNAIMALVDQWNAEEHRAPAGSVVTGDPHREERHERTYGQ
jgi:hypothetical protein